MVPAGCRQGAANLGKPRQTSANLGILSLVILLCLLIAAPSSLLAQEEEQGQVQLLTGRIEQGEVMHYDLPDLQQDDTLYVYMRNESGNFDPALLLVTPDMVTENMRQEIRDEAEALVSAGEDPIEALVQVLLANSLDADDNSGEDSDAAIEFLIPEDGDYLLLALGTPMNDTFGDYELIVGINEPLVLSGRGQSTGDEIAFLDEEASGIATAVQEISDSLTEEFHERFYTFNDVSEGDIIYAYVEATSGDLIPLIRLEDYSGRTLRNPNIVQREKSAMFEFPVGDVIDNYRIAVSACCEDTEPTTGDFRLVVGVNEPAVLDGQATPAGRQVIKGAQPVVVSARLQQITGVDQQAENYGGVYVLTMQWHDPDQAFSPDECRCQFKTFFGSGFSQLVSDENFRWPEFTIFNQQDNRWTQSQGIVIQANGDMTYIERFTTTLQAPDFDFTAFPFDTQRFFLHVDSLFPENFYVFEGPVELSELGDQLGEEEWAVTSYGTEVNSIEGLSAAPSSRFSFRFEAHRHLNFYIMRIFLPTILLIVVSYFTFFLKDYSKRIDVNSANLLVFVAFNFTISDDLPRLGYLTFLDAMMAGVFAITALVIAFNVFLRRLELTGKEDLAKKIDGYTLWAYPVAYLIGGAALTIFFLLPDYWDSILATLGIG
jgi:hypothetical protein